MCHMCILSRPNPIDHQPVTVHNCSRGLLDAALVIFVSWLLREFDQAPPARTVHLRDHDDCVAIDAEIDVADHSIAAVCLRMCFNLCGFVQTVISRFRIARGLVRLFINSAAVSGMACA